MACERGSPKPPSPVEPPPRYSGRLEDYVPAAGLRWLVRGSPAKLAESQSFRPALELLISSERLRAVAHTTGFALETLPRGVIAGFDLGTLYLAELPAKSAAKARQRFESRQIRDVATRSPDPNIVVLSGMNEGIPVGLVTLDERVVAYGVGDPTLCRVVEAYARGRLRAKSAFEGAALAGQASETDEAPLAVHVPGPFDERWHQAAGGLLEITTSLSAKLTPRGPQSASFELTLHGDFAGSNAAERLRSTYRAVAGSSTGTLLGLSSALDAHLAVSKDEQRVTLSVPLPITEVAKGAKAATSADLDEIFRLSPASSAAPTPTSTPDSR
jgi:hypothetical protein